MDGVKHWRVPAGLTWRRRSQLKYGTDTIQSLFRNDGRTRTRILHSPILHLPEKLSWPELASLANWGCSRQGRQAADSHERRRRPCVWFGVVPKARMSA